MSEIAKIITALAIVIAPLVAFLLAGRHGKSPASATIGPPASESAVRDAQLELARVNVHTPPPPSRQRLDDLIAEADRIRARISNHP